MKKSLEEYLKNCLRLGEINNWLRNNDWKVNKIVVGEWSTEDKRWQDYLTERKEKRKERDELLEIVTDYENKIKQNEDDVKDYVD